MLSTCASTVLIDVDLEHHRSFMLIVTSEVVEVLAQFIILDIAVRLCI